MGLLKILYRDEHVVAIHKPESLLVHRARISRDQIAALQLLRDQIGQFVYPVHPARSPDLRCASVCAQLRSHRADERAV